MKNIELKAKVNSMNSLRRRVKDIGAKKTELMSQIDTYFASKSGRLKLREINGKEFVLIQYHRPDTASHKISEFEILKLTKEQAGELKEMLAETMGVQVVVAKKRELWMYGDTRIHIDTVKNLGNFMELESQIKHGEKKARNEYDFLMKTLSLNGYEKINQSYSDLLMQTSGRK